MNTSHVSGSGGVIFPGGLPRSTPAVPAAWLAVVLVLSSSTTAFADPIRIITSGTFATGQEDTGFYVQGSDLVIRAQWGLDPVVQCGPCIPGTTLNLSSTVSVVDWPSPPPGVTFTGQTYDSVFFRGTLDFDAGSVIVPDIPPGGPTQILSSTFTFTGTLAAFAQPGGSGTPLFSTNLTGAGMGPFGVRVVFKNRDDVPHLQVYQLDYHFDDVTATPEPGSLLLFGSGAAWVAACWRKRRKDGTTLDAGEEQPAI